MPNPPIQPQTEGGNILTAWRLGVGGGYGDGRRMGGKKNEREGERL